MKQVQKLGSMKAIAKLIPGMPKISDEQQAQAEKEMKTFEAIIDSMTPYERKHPEILRTTSYPLPITIHGNPDIIKCLCACRYLARSVHCVSLGVRRSVLLSHLF